MLMVLVTYTCDQPMYMLVVSIIYYIWHLWDFIGAHRAFKTYQQHVLQIVSATVSLAMVSSAPVHLCRVHIGYSIMLQVVLHQQLSPSWSYKHLNICFHMFYNVFAYSDILEPLMDMYMTVSILYTLLDDVMVSLVCCLESRI